MSQPLLRALAIVAPRLAARHPVVSTFSRGGVGPQSGVVHVHAASLIRTSTRLFCSGPVYEASIESRLKEALGATACKVVDQSGGCGQSYAIAVEAESFRGKSRLQQQRMVQKVIKEDIAKWHAVTIQTTLPEAGSAAS
eukprot:TRINITY_DN4644_c0_g1_i1.p1 TRINITY_DN4644_c0_g1~~TRINITY_DN4644_c0_g1_i1.p1  ORF type:complete len:139 (+),score=32.27 TRINITY_DN4644_c0_g1_i1:103-519(+)